jgi:hypothetical protein
MYTSIQIKTQTQKGEGGVGTHEHFAHLKFEAKKEYSTKMLFVMQFVVFQICYSYPCKQTEGGEQSDTQKPLPLCSSK